MDFRPKYKVQNYKLTDDNLGENLMTLDMAMIFYRQFKSNFQ